MRQTIQFDLTKHKMGHKKTRKYKKYFGAADRFISKRHSSDNHRPNNFGSDLPGSGMPLHDSKGSSLSTTRQNQDVDAALLKQKRLKRTRFMTVQKLSTEL